MPMIFVDDERNQLEWREGRGRTVEIADIVVGTDRRTGIGTRLIRRLLEKVPQDTALIFAITRISNTVAHLFYEKNGFRIVGRLHEFYRDGGGATESALMYGLDL